MVGLRPAGLSAKNFLASFTELSKLHSGMSKSIIGDEFWAEMTEGQKVEAVFTGHATLKQMSEGLLDGSDDLRNACREFLAHTDPSFENLVVEHNQRESSTSSSSDASGPAKEDPAFLARSTAWGGITESGIVNSGPPAKQRFGLPEGFVPRLQRYGRAVLLELNVYRLPNGQEFIPCRPTGTLGARHHLYALFTRNSI